MKCPATLQVTFPFGQTLALAAALMVLLVGAAEWIARQPSVAQNVPGAVGSQNAVFDVKIGALDRLVAQKGPVACLFVGSSVVLMGIDPAVFEQAYQAQTGDELVCYNSVFRRSRPEAPACWLPCWRNATIHACWSTALRCAT